MVQSQTTSEVLRESSIKDHTIATDRHIVFRHYKNTADYDRLFIISQYLIARSENYLAITPHITYLSSPVTYTTLFSSSTPESSILVLLRCCATILTLDFDCRACMLSKVISHDRDFEKKKIGVYLQPD